MTTGSKAWKPAKGDGNYGKAVSAAAHARNAARRNEKSIDGKMVTGRPGGTNTGQDMTHSADASPNAMSPTVADPATGRPPHGMLKR